MTNNTAHTDILIRNAPPMTAASHQVNACTCTTNAIDHLTDITCDSLDNNEKDKSIVEVDLSTITQPMPPITTTVFHCKKHHHPLANLTSVSLLPKTITDSHDFNVMPTENLCPLNHMTICNMSTILHP